MKFMIVKLVMLSIVITLTGCKATPPYAPVEITKVVNTPSQDKKELFKKTRQWFSHYFVSGESVIDYEDQESGTIIGNGIANIGTDPFGLIAYKIKYNIRIDTKDGKFRALTKVLGHMNTDSNSTYDVRYVPADRIALAEGHVNKIVQDIESYINNKKLNDNSSW